MKAPHSWVNTKIVATVGPASSSVDKLTQLAEAGADVFRLNFAHGDWDSHAQVVRHIRLVEQQLDRPLAILQDLAGPKLRLGPLPEDGVHCGPGESFRLVRTPTGQPDELTCPDADLVQDLDVGNQLLLADGTVAMRVVAKQADWVELEVVVPGTIATRQGIAVPHAKLKMSALTPKDLQDLDFTAEHRIDYVGLSFVRRPEDVDMLRTELEKRGSQAEIVAKIEKAEALLALDDIIRRSDAIMVARGDLGVEIDIARVPLMQKHIIQRCQNLGVPVITATQMLESMRTNNRPTRAEVTDVANAILDGTDAVMLSAETASGQYPVDAVAMMNRIAQETEKTLPAYLSYVMNEADQVKLPKVLLATVNAASLLAEQTQASLMVIATRTGRSALGLAKHRNRTPSLGLCANLCMARKLALYWGVVPICYPEPEQPVDYLESVSQWALKRDWVDVGDRIVFLIGTSWDEGGFNSVIVHEVRAD